MNDTHAKKSFLREMLVLGGLLFWPILAFKLFSWLTEPVNTYKPLEDANCVVFTHTQPFHKTIQFLLVYRKDDKGYGDWEYKLKTGGWDQFYYDDGENNWIQFSETNYQPYPK
jgi:hypothetical protein